LRRPNARSSWVRAYEVAFTRTPPRSHIGFRGCHRRARMQDLEGRQRVRRRSAVSARGRRSRRSGRFAICSGGA
jgi:hypothetical protein